MVAQPLTLVLSQCLIDPVTTVDRRQQLRRTHLIKLSFKCKKRRAGRPAYSRRCRNDRGDKQASPWITVASDLSPQFESSGFFCCIYESQLPVCIRSLRLSRVGKPGGLSLSRQSFGYPENLRTDPQFACDAKVLNWHKAEVDRTSA
jgi:hypothetical protein